MLYLSKSKYCSAVQCPKMLWLFKNMPDKCDDSCMNPTVLANGNEVGDIAMGLYGEYTEVPYDEPGKMIMETADLISANVPVIAEASFALNGLFCSVDILLNHGDKRVSIVEVKSSSRIRDIYITDVAYQYHVLEGLGIRVEKASIAHIDTSYVRHGDLEPDKLFMISDVTDEVREEQAEVQRMLSFLEGYMSRTSEPCDSIGEQCFSPYQCGFFHYCGRDLPSPSIFDIDGIQIRTKLANYNKGIISFEDILSADVLKPDRMLQVEHELKTLPPLIDVTSIACFLKGFSFPLYFLDFESFQPAIPIFDDSSPYEQIPFQYSLHYIWKAGGELKHREYLADAGHDPRRSLAEQLCLDIPRGVCTVAYNMAFEKARIKRLAELCPDLSEHLMDIHDHMVDLMVPFKRRWYYNKAMKGSYSIKYVLPALFPDDPELDYSNLDGVHNGTEASAAFEKMASMTPEERDKCRDDLLKYCCLDTLAMVKIWQKLTRLST